MSATSTAAEMEAEKRERKRAYNQSWREANKARIKEYNKAYTKLIYSDQEKRQKKHAQDRVLYAKTKDQRKAYREYYQRTNGDKKRAAQRAAREVRRATALGHCEDRIKSQKHRCKKNGWKWKLTREEAICFMMSHCFYCGAPPDPCNGLDRYNNEATEYSHETVVPCCWPCNERKWTKPYHVFVAEMKLSGEWRKHRPVGPYEQ
jgi:hypothetical protein